MLCGFMQNHAGPKKKKHVIRKIEQNLMGDI